MWVTKPACGLFNLDVCKSSSTTSLLVTLLLGMFLLVGTLIVFLTDNDKKLVNFSIGLALSVMVMLAIGDLIPEAYELIKASYNLTDTIIIIVVSILIGIVILKILDLYIPDHDSDNKEQLLHIGIVSAVALVLHNIIEGMALYGVLMTSVKLGVLVCIGIGLHNIPLGLTITSTLFKANNNKKKTILTVLCVSLSTFVGGLLMFLFGNTINDFLLGVLLAITLGMILYIALFELLPHVRENKNKYTVFGILLGLILMIISTFIH